MMIQSGFVWPFFVRLVEIVSAVLTNGLVVINYKEVNKNAAIINFAKELFKIAGEVGQTDEKYGKNNGSNCIAVQRTWIYFSRF